MRGGTLLDGFFSAQKGCESLLLVSNAEVVGPLFVPGYCPNPLSVVKVWRAQTLVHLVVALRANLKKGKPRASTLASGLLASGRRAWEP